MMPSQIPSPYQIQKHRFTKQSQTHPPPQITKTIPQLHNQITQTFTKLQQNYMSIYTKKENYLLKIYIKILDKIFDELVYAQEKVNMVDCQHIKQQKCMKYQMEILLCKNMCHQYKEILDKKKQELRNEKYRTKQLGQQRDQLKIVQVNKIKELEQVKIKVKGMEKRRNNQMINVNQDKQKISQLKLGNQRKQFQTLKTHRFYKQSSSLKNTIFLLQNQDNRRQQQNFLSFRETFPEPFVTNHENNSKLSKTLWLYQPNSAYRKRKITKFKHRDLETLQKQQISTKKDSQSGTSYNRIKYKYKNQLNERNDQTHH